VVAGFARGPEQIADWRAVACFQRFVDETLTSYRASRNDSICIWPPPRGPLLFRLQLHFVQQ
jgi:hypothetical protein